MMETGRVIPPVVVRLEGGVGDHILGMRVLPFVHERFPDRELTILSDCGGNDTQAEIAAMCPLVNRVIKVFHRAGVTDVTQMGRLENLDEIALREMRAAHAFVDAWGAHFFLEASRFLQTPIFEIFAQRPAIVPPSAAELAADRILTDHAGRILVTMNLSKWGAALLAKCWERVLVPLLTELLADPRVVVFNLFATRFEFPQWPAELARYRKALLAEEGQLLLNFPKLHERVISKPDLPIGTVAALIRRSAYFIGMDNGIKHLAWALGIPLTCLNPTVPESIFALRWMPDVHRLLTFDASPEQIKDHINYACGILSQASLLRPESV